MNYLLKKNQPNQKTPNTQKQSKQQKAPTCKNQTKNPAFLFWRVFKPDVQE